MKKTYTTPTMIVSGTVVRSTTLNTGSVPESIDPTQQKVQGRVGFDL